MKHEADSRIRRDAKVRDLKEYVDGLEAKLNSEIDKLSLLCQAMWSLTEENTDMTDEALESRILELEILDGKLLEEIEDIQKSCPRCNAAVPADMDKCQFCGHAL
jgi:rRNA maturation endonuclease Nob1